MVKSLQKSRYCNVFLVQQSHDPNSIYNYTSPSLRVATVLEPISCHWLRGGVHQANTGIQKQANTSRLKFVTSSKASEKAAVDQRSRPIRQTPHLIKKHDTPQTVPVDDERPKLHSERRRLEHATADWTAALEEKQYSSVFLDTRYFCSYEISFIHCKNKPLV